MSNFEWFIRALGFWYCLTLVVGFSVFARSCSEVLRKARIRFWGFHGAMLLLPPVLISLMRAVAEYLDARSPFLNLTSTQIAHDVILSAASSLVHGFVVAFPSFVVLLIGWLLTRGSDTRSGPSP